MDSYFWTILFCCCVILLMKLLGKSSHKPCSVPRASFCLPLVGHAWALLLPNFKDFLLSCHHTHGPIFSISIFSQKLIYICSEAGVRSYFKADETTLSLYALFGIDKAFGSPGFPFSKVIQVLRSGFAVNPSRYLEELGSLCVSEIGRASPESWTSPVPALKSLSRRWVDLATAQALLGIELSETGLANCVKYESFFHSTVAMGFLGLPKIFVEYLTRGRMARLRHAMVSDILKEFRSYKTEDGKEDSRLLRSAMDTITQERGTELSDTELEGIICALMLGGSENTAVLIVNVLVQLSLYPDCLDKIRAEVEPPLRAKDWTALISAPYLDAVVKETMRLTMGCFTFQRQNSEEYIVSDYVIPPKKTIILAAPIIQVYGDSARAKYSDPESFNPSRFLTQESGNLLTFGAGRHHCPAKTFSLHLIKLGVATMCSQLELEIAPDTLRWDYAAYSIFAESQFQAKITRRVADK